MIPNILHYCWFSGDNFPPVIQLCTRTWSKRLPHMRVRKWDKAAFDQIPDKPDWVMRAFEQKKWAFVADYVRQYAVYTEGGWYFDSDVFVVHQDFTNKYRNCHFVSSPEDAVLFYGGPAVRRDGYVYGVGVQAACFGGEQGCDVCGRTLDLYKNIGDYLQILESGDSVYYPIAPQIMQKACDELGVFLPGVLNTYEKKVGGKTYVFDTDICSNGKLRETMRRHPRMHCVHLCQASWRGISQHWKNPYDTVAP